MIGYVSIGTNDAARAGAFYDALLAELGASRVMESDAAGFIAWAENRGDPMLMVIKPFDGSPASVGNGVMVALGVDARDQVDAVHAKAMALGAPDEGKPGLRGETFYAAYFRDPDGHKLAVFVKDWMMG